MDAPPDKEDILCFIKIANHLQNLGVSAPTILGQDSENGFALVDDLGDQTFTRLLASGSDEAKLYRDAIDVLIGLHKHPDATRIELGQYDFSCFAEEVSLFTEWYLPELSGEMPDAEKTDEFLSLWQNVFESLPDIGTTLVLRDYHVDNLIMFKKHCAVLDFQDALTGSPAYDLVSLLEDARRDIDSSVANQSLAQYFAALPNCDKEDFALHYAVWGAQRHCKVAGIFSRLWRRDNKPHYLQHLPRVMPLLFRNLSHPALSHIKDWFVANEITPTPPEFEQPSK